MNNFESEKKNHPVEVIDDVLEQVSGGISEPVEYVGSEGPIEGGRDVVKFCLQQPQREGNYGTETEKIV